MQLVCVLDDELARVISVWIVPTALVLVAVSEALSALT
jgi:hypothetical protein